MDEGGRTRARAYQRIYYRRFSGIIFVVDSNDRECIDKARDKLIQMLNEEELRNKHFLIFANKQDLSNAMTLNLNKLNDNSKWHLQSSCAIRNEGIHEGFKWLVNSIVEHIDLIKPINETVDDLTTMKHSLMSIWNMVNFKTL
ncbi:unnamed protein product [Rotaria sp. Silwood1]|nr:unnamed protein product [Rotaria sp. Silwood1]